MQWLIDQTCNNKFSVVTQSEHCFLSIHEFTSGLDWYIDGGAGLHCDTTVHVLPHCCEIVFPSYSFTLEKISELIIKTKNEYDFFS